MRAPDFLPPFAPALPRFSLPLRRWTACLVLLAPPLAMTQTALNAADPQAATAPLHYTELPTPAPETATPNWRQAHEAVAEFPRGHADILAWEASAAAAQPAPTAALGWHAQHGQPPVAPGAAAEAGKAAHPHKPMHSMQPGQRHGPMHDAHQAHHPHGGKP